MLYKPIKSDFPAKVSIFRQSCQILINLSDSEAIAYLNPEISECIHSGLKRTQRQAKGMPAICSSYKRGLSSLLMTSPKRQF